MNLKKINWLTLLIVVLLLFSCGGANSVDNFYNRHKDDSQVTAIRVPQTMLTLLSGLSPELQSIIGNTKDIRFMRFSGMTQPRIQSINEQMNSLTTSSFIEVYRKNDELKRNVVSIREKRNTVKEILVYNNDNVNATLLYFNGNFDPQKVRNLAQNEQLNGISDNLFQQFKGPSISE
ncbi:MAG: DUF4252 domain-containing protein [Flavobacteriaceae bacterium]